jgi:putative component of membrane protein insertase Oxa1/YidC/SpoIIIJ protein YidD
MKLILFLIFFISINIFAQVNSLSRVSEPTDWQKWGKANYSYQIPDETLGRDFSIKYENVGGIILKSFADAYWFFISDVDGDNCSFSPTCSSFFIAAVKETNAFQGTLMFADRFTRDLNLFKLNHYPRVKDGHFYDPVSFYTLDNKKINIIPVESVVNSE